jgi:hypothetical protein
MYALDMTKRWDPKMLTAANNQAVDVDALDVG